MQIKIGHLSSSTQNSTVIDESNSSLLLFDIVPTTFIPGQISSEKRCRNYCPLPNLGRFTVVVSLTGDEYVGEFHEGLPTGVGQFFYTNGDREEVLMEAGVRHGR